MEEIFESEFCVDKTRRYNVERKIGEGAFGEVRKAIDTQVDNYTQ
jgi:hypothetical protein